MTNMRVCCSLAKNPYSITMNMWEAKWHPALIYYPPFIILDQERQLNFTETRSPKCPFSNGNEESLRCFPPYCVMFERMKTLAFIQVK